MSAQIKLLRSIVLGVVAASLLAITACLDDSPVAPAATPAQLQLRVLLGNGSIPEDDWTVAIRVFYFRRNESEVDLPATPSTIQVERGAQVTRSVQVNISPCLDDPERVRDEGDEDACELFVEVQLLDGDVVLSEETHEALVSNASEVVEVEPFTLPAGELSYDGSAALFSAAQGGPIPDARSYAITGTTSQSFGTLSTEITYGNGTGWLTATVDQSEGSSVTIRPANTELAPGVYNAWVEVNSNRGFVPAEIVVQYTVTERAKTLTIGGAGPGSGSVSSNPAGAACTSTASALSGTCSLTFTHGATVTLAATPAFGSAFAGWTGACTGTTCSLAMTSDRAVTANFTLLARQLTVTAAGTGNGTVTSVPSVVTCTATAGVATGLCVAQLNHGNQVTLTATPSANSTFTGWTGGVCSGTALCTVTMDQARSVGATFTLIPRTLTMSGAGGGSGLVTSNPSGITCNIANAQTTGACVVSFGHGTVVTLTASPSSGSVFQGWAGACAAFGTGNCTITMDQARNVTAQFIPALQRLFLNGAGGGSGTVASSPGGINCTIVGGQLSGTCAFDFVQNSNVTLTATPTGGGSFGGWAGSCTVTGATCVVTMNQPTAITATFIGAPPPGRDIAVFNDINSFDDGAMRNQGNERLVKNLVSFTSSGSRNAGTIVQMDCGRPGPFRFPGSFCPPSSLFQSAITGAGYTFEIIRSTQGTLTSIKAGVKVLFLLFPCEAFTREEVNTLKRFAEDGGRIVFLGEHNGFFGECIPAQNQFLRDMGAQMTNTGNATDSGVLPAEFIRPHQITEGVTGFQVSASSHIVPGPNDYALVYSQQVPGAVLSGVARIDVTPLVIGDGVIVDAPTQGLRPRSLTHPPVTYPDAARVPRLPNSPPFK